jgi:hypothetical protein
MMKSFSIIVTTLIFILLLFSCTERFPVDFPKSQPKIVIEALITDRPGPYFVRLTRTTDSIIIPKWVNEYSDPILNAQVIISSDDGIIDTLKQYHYPSSEPYQGDSLLGYYRTGSWTAKVGQRYYLDVFYEGKQYHSEETMLPTLTIDTCRFEFQYGAIGKSNGNLPIVRFKSNCNTSGYYMVNLTMGKSSNPNYFIYNSGNYSLITGTNIIDCSIGLYNLSDPYFPYIREHYANASPWGDTASIFLYSISKTAYYFHGNLFKQLTNDGGTFKPSPATPLSNISNNAIGIFQVSSVSEYIIPHLP